MYVKYVHDRRIAVEEMPTFSQPSVLECRCHAVPVGISRVFPVVSMKTRFYFSPFSETEFYLLCVQCAYYVLPSLPLMVHTLLAARLIECVWQLKLKVF